MEKQSPSKTATVQFLFQLVLLATTVIFSNQVLAQQPPPELGQKTKGEPAFDENRPLPEENSDDQSASAVIEEGKARVEEEGSLKESNTLDSLLGTATVKESKRESGQVYRIELEHSSGSKQYIEETDSDGKIESTSNDIEETPNLPKWKLGSW